MKTTQINIKYISVILIFLFLSSLTIGQNRLEKAQDYKDNFQFAKALEIYKDIYKNKKPKKDEIIRDIAHCYIMTNDIKSAQEWLSEINGLTVYKATDVLNYANALKSSGLYDEAIIQYKRYANLFKKDTEKVEGWIKQCKVAQHWIANPLPYEVQNVESINTENSEFGIIQYSSGYLFSSDRKLNYKKYKTNDIFGWTGNPYLKLYSFSDIDENISTNDVLALANINLDHHNGPGIFDKENDILYYTITKLQKDNSKIPANADPTSWTSYDREPERYINRLEIYSAKIKDKKWEIVEPFKYNNSENYSVGHPAISPDGNTLYFSSDMPGGFGSSDIYYCEKQTDGSWSAPINAGSKINSEGKEGFPFIDKNDVLYFSSDGLPGMGGLDIFKVFGSKNNWSDPENLRYPINSPKDDFSMFLEDNKDKGYFASNRDNGKGGDDIYYFSKRQIIVGITKTKLADNSIVPLDNVNIFINNVTDNTNETKQTNYKGQFRKKSDCDKAYEIIGTIDGYFVESTSVITDCAKDTMYVELMFEKIEKNKTYALENIYYDYNKWNIRSDASIELDQLVKVLYDNPQIDIELGSHTDSRGTKRYNENLSQKRAESAVEYIISMGISGDRITAKGYGEYQLINKCADGVKCSEEAHQLNRRTEFKVTNIREN